MDKDSYLMELVRYIHLNPQRAKMEKEDVYPWTSHRQYSGKDRDPLAPVKTATVLLMFSKIKAIARRKYMAYMKEKHPQGKWNELYDLRGGRILGDEEFEQETYMKAGEQNETSIKLKLDIKEIWTEILERDGLKTEPVGWQRSRLMGETAYLAMEGVGIRQKEVADYFKVEPTALNKAVKRLGERWENGKGSRVDLMRWAKNL